MGLFNEVAKPFKVGETCHIFMSNHNGNTTEGRVLAIINLPGYTIQHYIVEVPSYVDPLLFVRNGIMDMHKQPIVSEKIEAEVENEDDWKFDAKPSTYEVVLQNISTMSRVTAIVEAFGPDEAINAAINKRKLRSDNWAEWSCKKIEATNETVANVAPFSEKELEKAIEHLLNKAKADTATRMSVLHKMFNSYRILHYRENRNV